MYDSYEFTACLRSALLEESARRMVVSHRQMPNAILPPDPKPVGGPPYSTADAVTPLSDDDYQMLLQNLVFAEACRKNRADYWWEQIRRNALHGRTKEGVPA